jgi:Pin2-interacting protein X1
LKDDNLGLGAKRVGVGEAPSNFGLNVFNGLLGRLNGKSEADIQKSEADTSAKVLKMYHAQRWGHITFVPGGLLERDELKELPTDSPATALSPTSNPEGPVDSKPSKRKRGADEDSELDVESSSSSKRAKSSEESEKQKKKRKKDRKGTDGDDTTEADKRAVDKTKKKKKDRSQEDAQADGRPGEKTDKARRREEKAEKKRRKEEKKRRKEEKRSKKEKRKSAKSSPDSSAISSSDDESSKTKATASPNPTLGTRNLSRQKYIQQKRMASRNAQALNEVWTIFSYRISPTHVQQILMIKSSA